MSILSSIKNSIASKRLIVAGIIFSFTFFGLTTLIFATAAPGIPSTDPSIPADPTEEPTNPGYGEVRGHGWMGAGIMNPNSSEGGGGWLRFHCQPDQCGSNSWGVTVNLDENSPQRGYFSGQAWSSNYGWLDFSPDIVNTCWEANPSETANDIAHILYPTGKIVGWAKFVAGDDIANDGWDGCVSFSGVEYGANVDLDTGALQGWAWGSEVVGWISFQNPECPFCDPTIVFPDRVIGCMEPEADNYNPNATLPGRCIYLGCTDSTASNYDPTANQDDGSCIYGGGPTVDLTVVTNMPPNYVPVGSSNIFDYQVSPRWTFTNPTQVGTPYCHGKFFDEDGIEQTLTSWTGADLDRPSATSLPPWFVGPYSFTNNVATFAPGVVAGEQFTFKIECTDINGNIFSDTAPVIFRGTPPSRPRLTLDVQPSLFTIGTPNVGAQYQATTITWTTTNSSLIAPNSCTGSFVKVMGAATATGTVPGWTTGVLVNPNPSASISAVNLTSQMSGMSDGDFFRFTITCGIVGGGTVSAIDTIIMQDPIVPPVTSALDLRVFSPNTDGNWNFELISSAGNPVTLDWTGTEILWDSCNGTSEQFDSDGDPIGSNASWNTSGADPYNSGPGNMSINTATPNNVTTAFTLSCMDTNGMPINDSVVVCVDGTDAYCPRSAGGFPGYEEF